MDSDRALIFLVLLLIIATALGGVALLWSRPPPIHITIKPPLPTATPAPSSTPPPLIVYVTGAVWQPGARHILPYGSRVSDAVAAAGGLNDLANRQRVNMAAVLRDGDHVHVPSTALRDGEGALPTPAGGAFVRVNFATHEELQALPGIGPALAQRIIAYREDVSRFADFDDLDEVPGIGPATLENLSGRVVFD